ncbi:MAG: hypothetical protein WBP56_10585 [Polyangia bacterium]|jgi:hypothetical protein
MRVTVDFQDTAIEVLDAQASDDPLPGLNLVATMELYALRRLSSSPVSESTGNGRVEFLYRLAKFGVRSFEQTPQALAQESLPLRFFRS